ncbi:ribonuclease P 40kDa subunit-domain-containing protein [Tricharina praecox]|uniref:ribonuclease P 40kDa subunit-domain-containing protein n=1 Tax=Tricharina praecox TaxID=43433 RepID=UPI00221EC2F9|nr:ribonuclease P 40kDa subunit-domain-containing protein [Tricharina praecox]KAI5855928.1 ribonuclease P 40kDa subunit-domain-containing protein [Tricharina praecox]
MPSPKCFVSLSKPPAKKRPFVNIFNHQVDLILPTDIYDIISKSLHSCPSLTAPPTYHRLVMPLGAILEPDFFNTYIKSGNILLLSHGRLDVDNIFTLSDGVLRMSLDTEAYERAGLQGQPSKFGNGPGVMKRRRFVVELNLRSPSYLTNSKQFNRLKRACDAVFSSPQPFLFADLFSPAPASIPSVVQQFPARTATPEVSALADISIPTFVAPPGSTPHGGGKSAEANYHREVWRDWAMEVYEYLSLVLLGADRLRADDSVDPYLSTYAVENAAVGSVTRVRLRGLVSAKWVEELWATVEGLFEGREEWVGMVVHGFDDVPFGPIGKQRGGLEACGSAYTVLKLPGDGGVMVWDIAGGQSE